jgi:hypothetical protein
VSALPNGDSSIDTDVEMSDYGEFRNGGDYLFQVSNIHLALQKLEGEVRLKNEEHKKKTEKEI